MLIASRALDNGGRAQTGQAVNDGFHHILGGGSAGGDANPARPGQPGQAQVSLDCPPVAPWLPTSSPPRPAGSN